MIGWVQKSTSDVTSASLKIWEIFQREALRAVAQEKVERSEKKTLGAAADKPLA